MSKETHLADVVGTNQDVARRQIYIAFTVQNRLKSDKYDTS